MLLLSFFPGPSTSVANADGPLKTTTFCTPIHKLFANAYCNPETSPEGLQGSIGCIEHEFAKGKGRHNLAMPHTCELTRAWFLASARVCCSILFTTQTHAHTHTRTHEFYASQRKHIYSSYPKLRACRAGGRPRHECAARIHNTRSKKRHRAGRRGAAMQRLLTKLALLQVRQSPLQLSSMDTLASLPKFPIQRPKANRQVADLPRIPSTCEAAWQVKGR